MADPMFWVVLVIVLGLMGVLALYFNRSSLQGYLPARDAADETSPRMASASNHPYHAVSCEGDCPALAPYKGKRYLAAEAPSLPVPGCTNSRCQCRYLHYEDRRSSDGDRRGLMGMRAEVYAMGQKQDRRQGWGRRASDHAMA